MDRINLLIQGLTLLLIFFGYLWARNEWKETTKKKYKLDMAIKFLMKTDELISVIHKNINPKKFSINIVIPLANVYGDQKSNLSSLLLIRYNEICKAYEELIRLSFSIKIVFPEKYFRFNKNFNKLDRTINQLHEAFQVLYSIEQNPKIPFFDTNKLHKYEQLVYEGGKDEKIFDDLQKEYKEFTKVFEESIRFLQG